MDLARFVPFLKYGLYGLVLAMAIATYGLLHKEAGRDEVRTIMIVAIMCYFGLCIVMAVAAGWIEYLKSKTPRFGKLIGSGPVESFMDGGDSQKLAGRWKVRWTTGDATENEKKNYPKLENDQVPPPEDHDLEVDGAQIYDKAIDPTTKAPRYWLFGRVSSENHVTLIYWSDHRLIEAYLVGTVFLNIVEKVNEPIKMVGWWRGYVTEKEIVHGEVEWEKVD